MNPQQYPPQPGPGPQGYPPQGPPAGYPSQPAPSGGMPPYQQQPAPQPGYPSAPFGSPMPGQQPAPPASYNPYDFATNPSYAPAPAKKGPNKAVLAAIVILGLLAVMIVALTLMPSGDNKNNANQNQNNNANQAAKDVADRDDGTLDLSSRVTLNQSLKAQKLQAKVKQQVNLSSGFSFMVNKIEDYTSPNPTTKPADGKKFIVITTVVGNRLNSGNLSVSYLDFRLRDSDNNALPGHIVTNEILANQLSSPTEIKPGEQITGKVVFEVSATDTSWVFKHSETYQKTTDNTTFTVEGEIVVGTTATD